MTPDELAAAYEGLEDAASFADRATLERYRAGLLDRTAPQAQFVAGYLGARARVLEVACGNGRLLIDLARRGTLAHGLGVDLARSRIAFARAWAADQQIDVLQFDVADALDPRHEPGGFSGALCVTGAFGYFEPLQSGAGARLTRVLLDALEPGGRLFLELYPHPCHRRLLAATGGEARIWHELPPEDPWRFYLSRLALDGDVLTHEKTFVHRTSGRIDSGRHERLHLYDRATAVELLASAGFAEIRVHEGWTENDYRGGEVMVITAVRPSPR